LPCCGKKEKRDAYWVASLEKNDGVWRFSWPASALDEVPSPPLGSRGTKKEGSWKKRKI